ncbi:hypothetical protein FRB94_004820 [Tulasnella sp. JGI-2019a]|nr:hypothetical protein FRB94_004820 [Tulasnella sp. JGI-2019a]
MTKLNARAKCAHKSVPKNGRYVTYCNTSDAKRNLVGQGPTIGNRHRRHLHEYPWTKLCKVKPGRLCHISSA